eukprot:g11620.t1
MVSVAFRLRPTRTSNWCTRHHENVEIAPALSFLGIARRISTKFGARLISLGFDFCYPRPPWGFCWSVRQRRPLP